MGAIIMTVIGFAIAWFIGKGGGNTTQLVMLVLLAVFGLVRAAQVCSNNVSFHPARSWGFWWMVINVVALQFAARAVLLVFFMAGTVSFGEAIMFGIAALFVSFVAGMPAILFDRMYKEESAAELARIEMRQRGFF
jgi:hypothetical protein